MFVRYNHGVIDNCAAIFQLPPGLLSRLASAIMIMMLVALN
jgi:hypothetical protein